ncbi:GntR family transcriptional regulator [Mitsuaria sp. 7]|uniref:GntR family transcriptional regulator n=1 Tax=Mitsuaria sp. 7 TaxID=1658665 RepID=UPI0007DDCB3C|nr:GntR family transcriptional regulator [Mitsuaria sp. 7]ANH70345.1 GntR family transcriptional regulator [Mitsuaria sp. 7]
MNPKYDEDDNTLPARIARALIERIVTGVLRPGERVGQDAIAAEFGASHVPVREAFRRVEARGLLISEPRKGVRVSALDDASIVEITAMRAALEPLALRSAWPSIAPADLVHAQSAINEGAKAKDMQAWEAANREFHFALYRPSGMRRLLASIDVLHEARTRCMYATAPFIAWDPGSQREHREMLAAVRKGDVERACMLLERHIAEAGQTLIQGLTRWRASQG